MKKFWNFKAAASGGELYLYGEISDETWFGDEVTPAQFQKDLAALGDIKTLDVYINSPGGDVFAGQTIYNIIKRHAATVTVHIDGYAASAASIIAMAGDKIVVPANATLMIHNAWTRCCGNKEKFLKIAETLAITDAEMAQVYADRTGVSIEDVTEMMDAETWMSGTEAVEKGFADELEENKKIAACADASKVFARYKHPPETQPQNPAHAHIYHGEIPKHSQTLLDNKAVNQEAAEQGGFLVPQNPTDNGGESQPAADTSALDAQRRRFALNDKKKILTEE